VFTQCPECGTVFRVTATVLRAARGQVRCGVCDATFDALQYLMEEFEADTDAGSTLPRTGPDPRLADTAEHRRLVADDGEPADAEAEEDLDDELDDDLDDAVDGDLDAGGTAAGTASDDPVDAEAEEALLEAASRFDDPRAPRGATAASERDDAFPLEELDDPIDVIAQPTAGPSPEFPPFEGARATAASPAAGEVAFDETNEIELEAFDHRAGRNTPSADEDRALAEIAAAIARGSPPRAQGAVDERGAESASADDEHSSTVVDEDPPSIEIDLLDPSDAENIVLSEGVDDDTPPDVRARLLAAGDAAEIPDSALEFDLPAEHWDRVFVQDSAAAPLSAVAVGGDDPAAGATDDLDTEFDFEDDDGDLDDEDLRQRGLDADGAAAPAQAAKREPAEPNEDPLARTDEFPPLRVTLAEEAAAGLADTPAARPRQPGVSPEDFDALVAAAAARAAAEVAARVGVAPGVTATAAPAMPTTADSPTASRTGGAAALAAAPAASTAVLTDGPVATSAATLDPAADGRAEATWFDARRDLAPEGAPIATAESAETIQFDAERFHAIASEGGRRAWWATALLVLGALVLATGLAAQAAHFWRDALAQHPLFGPPLREVYARLDLPLEPQWSLAAYDVKQWGATADAAPGTLRVRASVVNRAPRAQPYPLLRVTLLDRYSAKVARREFAPAEYLPGRSAPAGMLAAGARADADLQIADPGSEAVGFELDVCLMQRGALVCATDQRYAAP
jgi:predicted Zn finger-like uncharacterized protein